MLLPKEQHPAEEVDKGVGDVAVDALVHIGVAREVVLVGAADDGHEGDAEGKEQENEQRQQPAQQLFFGEGAGRGSAGAAAHDAIEHQPAEHQRRGESGDVVGVADGPLVVADVAGGDQQRPIFNAVGGPEHQLDEGRDYKEPQHKDDEQLPHHPQGLQAGLTPRGALLCFLFQALLHIGVKGGAVDIIHRFFILQLV